MILYGYWDQLLYTENSINMHLFIPLLCFNIYIILEAYHDAKDGEKTHWIDWIIRAMWGTLIAYWMFGFTYAALGFDLTLCFWIWLLFDTTYNLLSGKNNPIYVGESAGTDIWFRKHFTYPGLAMLIAKILGMIGSLAFFIISLN